MATISKKIRIVEGKMYRFGQTIKDKLFGFMANYLIKLKISANQITFVRFFIILPIILLINVQPHLVLVFLIICFYLDGLDGTVARLSQKHFKSGKWLDMFADNLFTVIFALAMIWHGLLDGFWGALHLVMFMLNFGVSVYNNSKSWEDMPFFKSIYFYYLAYLIFIFSNNSFFDQIAIFFAVYLIVKNGLLLWNLFSKMKNEEI